MLQESCLLAETKCTFQDQLGGIVYKSMLPAEQKTAGRPRPCADGQVQAGDGTVLSQRAAGISVTRNCIVRAGRATFVPIYLKEADVAELADMPSVIDALREAFAAEARGEAKHCSAHPLGVRRAAPQHHGRRQQFAQPL